MPKTALLPVQITDAEKLIISGEQSALITEIEKLKAEKAAMPERIKTLEGSLYLKNHALIAGVIEREVEIREEANPFSAKVKVFRVDTGEYVRERDMDPEEAQMQLGNSSVPGPAPDNVRSLAEHREKSEEQLAAGTPEEAEALREARLADEREARVNELVSALTIQVADRGDGTFVARVTAGDVPGVAQAAGLSGPIRSDSGTALTDLVKELRGMIIGAGYHIHGQTVDGVHVGEVDDPARAAELAALAEQQAADDATTPKPKALLKVPKGAKSKAKGKKLKIEDGNGAPLVDPENPNGVDTTPPPGGVF